MPFMIGRAPIRRTIKYLESGKLLLKDQIKIFTVNYSYKGDNHIGAKEFAFWYLPQIQYKNPNVQIVTLQNLTPTPFIRCFYEDGKEMVIDVNGKDRNEIMKHLLKVVGKSKQVLKSEALDVERKENIANFGSNCGRYCICDVPGQVPCPGVVPVPTHMRGKYKYGQKM